MDNWLNVSDEYYVQDGCMVKKADGYGNIYSKEQYSNFVLKFEIQPTPGGNNGLGLRHIVRGKGDNYLGMEPTGGDS